jgi:hypothetical protein
MLVVGTAAAHAQQQAATPRGEVPAGEQMLGSITIPRNVMADGKPLARGTYQVRLTANSPAPASGASTNLERWVEFLQKGQVAGREIASIATKDDGTLLKAGANSAKVELLKDNAYARAWINRGGLSYLIYLPLATP